MSSASTGWASNFGTLTPWKDQALAGSASTTGTAEGDVNRFTNDGSSPVTSSASRMLGTATAQPASQQGGTLAQSLTAGLGTMNRATGVTTGAIPGQVKTAATPTYTVSQGTPVSQAAANSTGPADLSAYGSTYTGPQVVTVRTNSGNQAYYQFDPKTGQYVLAGVYDGQGNALNSGSTTTIGSIPAGAHVQQMANGIATGTLANGNNFSYVNGRLTEYTSVNSLTAAQRAGAVGTSLGGGTQVDETKAGSYASSINQAYATQEGQYQNAYTAAQTAAQAANAQANDASDTAYILDYMVAHNGQVPGVNRPGMTGVPMSQTAFDAAAQQYQANNAAQFTNAVSLQAPDTTAVDKNSLAALFSLMSQGQTGVAGADSAAQQAALGTAGTYQAGQNLIAHDKDYADKYNTNLATFADAVTKQSAADTNATGQKLSQDITNVSDMLNQLQQAAQQLGTTSQQAISSQIQNLQNQISDYQVAAAQYGANSSQATTLARGILSAGGSLASAGLA